MRILGIDYGRKRVGIAGGDDDTGFAFPLAVLHVNGERDAIRQVAERCRAEGAGKIVLGLPLNMDGSHGPMAEEVTRFGAALAQRTGLPVDMWDERLTTWSVEEMLISADVSRDKRKAVRDKLAAQQILQNYIDAKGQAGPTP